MEKTMSEPTVTVPVRLLENLIDNVYELKGERHWWKDEPRCRYQERYLGYIRDTQEAEEILEKAKEKS